MVTQEDVLLLSILYFLLAHIVIRGDTIPERIVAIGLVSLGLSLVTAKVSKEIGIHFAI
jgi:multisubunit Na+/H+ antiporter MnhF subunit